MKRSFILPPAFIALLVFPSIVSADVPEACYNRVVGEMVEVHDEYRARLFGSRRDSEGNFSVLTGGTTSEEHVGVFETKGRQTSELVEPALESYRVYRCRTMAVCDVLRQSLGRPEEAVSELNVHLLGCTEQTLESYDECSLAVADDAKNDNTQSDAVRITQECDALADATLRVERSVLRLAVAYDAGYRSLLQLAGIMDWMLEAFPSQTIRAVADMVNILGKLHQIPCFIAQCDRPPTDGLAP